MSLDSELRETIEWIVSWAGVAAVLVAVGSILAASTVAGFVLLTTPRVRAVSPSIEPGTLDDESSAENPDGDQVNRAQT